MCFCTAVSCPDGYVTVPGADTCYKIIPRLVNWTEAQEACRYQGRPLTGNLVVILDEAHSNAITRWIVEQADSEYVAITRIASVPV